MIEDQIGERSLAKQQEKLEEEEAAAEAEGSSGSEEDDSGSAIEHGGRGRALLRSEDDELERLDGVSSLFFLLNPGSCLFWVADGRGGAKKGRIREGGEARKSLTRRTDSPFLVFFAIRQILREIHHDYYDSHDRRKAKLANGTPMKSKSSSSSPPDVKVCLSPLSSSISSR